MAPQAPILLSPSELSYLHTSLSLQPPIRPDARAPTSFRPLVAETDLLPSANGSARLCFTDGTEAIVGVKGEVERTGDARRNVNVRGEEEEMGGTESEEFRKGRGRDRWTEVSVDVPGQRDDDAMVVFLAQMIHEGLVADGGLTDRLIINREWHWRLYIDVCNIPFFRHRFLPQIQLINRRFNFSSRSSSSPRRKLIRYRSFPSQPTSPCSPPAYLP